MTESDRYPANVFWSDEDEGFIAEAPDLPGCSAFGETQAEALAELQDAIAAWIEAARAAGNRIPEPSRPAAEHHSGKVLLRMPRSLHTELAAAAKHDDVSLNQYIVYVITKWHSQREAAAAGTHRFMMRISSASCHVLGQSFSSQFLGYALGSGLATNLTGTGAFAMSSKEISTNRITEAFSIFASTPLHNPAYPVISKVPPAVVSRRISHD